MLKTNYYEEATELDKMIYEIIVPEEHYLRKVLEIIDFEKMREKIEEPYSRTEGRPAEDPVRMLKLDYLKYHYNLSNREVMREAQVNMAYRYFLNLSLESKLPDASLLSVFKKRMGEKKYKEIFEEIVKEGRERGIVKDKLRLKDATHIIGDVAIPSTIGLIGQVRERILRSVEKYEGERVEKERRKAEQIRENSADLKDEERLLMRVKHLQEIMKWVEEVKEKLRKGEYGEERESKKIEVGLETGYKLLGEKLEGKKKDKLRSGVDPDVRRGKHGKYYDGYLLDIIVDPASELVTGIGVLSANDDEAGNAKTLIEAEEAAHQNKIEAISIDGIGFQGKVLRELQDPEGLNIKVYVPPHSQGKPEDGKFKAEDFELSEDGARLRCPRGEETEKKQRNKRDTATTYRFTTKQCSGCLLLEQCLSRPVIKQGRVVTKNDYQLEYDQARKVALTEKYKEVRKEHPKVERKLADIVRNHGGRRARYRGKVAVTIQYLMTVTAVNIKRLVRLVYQADQLPLAPNPI